MQDLSVQVQIQPRKHVSHYADYTGPTRQHEQDIARSEINVSSLKYLDQDVGMIYLICPMCGWFRTIHRSAHRKEAMQRRRPDISPFRNIPREALFSPTASSKPLTSNSRKRLAKSLAFGDDFHSQRSGNPKRPTVHQRLDSRIQKTGIGEPILPRIGRAKAVP